MKQRSLPWVIGGGVLGAAVFGALGFLFGKYGLIEMDFLSFFPEFRDPQGVGSLSAWLIGLAGMVGGSRYGRHIAQKRERAQRRKRERDESGREDSARVASSTRPR